TAQPNGVQYVGNYRLDHQGEQVDFMDNLLLEQLRERPVLCDGAMGTLLYARGVTYEQSFDALNLTHPELIQSIHSEYISAGAEIIETNTFGANRVKLEAHNLGERV